VKKKGKGVHRMTKKRKIIIGVAIVAVVFLAVLFLNPINLYMISVRRFIHKTETTLRKPEVYMPIGEALVIYCQSYPLLQSLFAREEGECDRDIRLSGAWLPKAANAFDSDARIRIGEQNAFAGFGGGFFGYGYKVSLTPKLSTTATNVWQLFRFSSSTYSDHHLATLHMDATRQFTPDEMLSNVVAHCEAHIQREPDNEHIWIGKVKAYLLFNRITEARETCRAMLDVIPEESEQAWWPMLTVALITAEEESFERAEQMMTQWAEKDGHFSRYLNLACFYQLSGKPDKAAEAIRLATGHSEKTGITHWTRYFAAAMYAYTSREYDSAVLLFDHLLTVISDKAPLYHPVLLKSRAAILEAQQHPDEAKPLEQGEGLSDYAPYRNFDIERLLQRPVPRPTKR